MYRDICLEFSFHLDLFSRFLLNHFFSQQVQ